MSYIKEDFKCPKCNNKNRIKIRLSLDESYLKQIINNTLFNFKCKNCNEEITTLYDTSYIVNNFHVYLRNNKEEVNDNFNLSRVCYTYDDFKEKIMILTDNLNDIVICFIECFLMENEHINGLIRYTGKNDTDLIFYSIDDKRYLGFDISDYNNIINNSIIKETNTCCLIDLNTFRNYFKLR